MPSCFLPHASLPAPLVLAGNQTPSRTSHALPQCWCRLHCPAFASLSLKAPSKEYSFLDLPSILYIQEQWETCCSKDRQGGLDPTCQRIVFQRADKHSMLDLCCRYVFAGLNMHLAKVSEGGKPPKRTTAAVDSLFTPRPCLSLHLRINPRGPNTVWWSVGKVMDSNVAVALHTCISIYHLDLEWISLSMCSVYTVIIYMQLQWPQAIPICAWVLWQKQTPVFSFWQPGSSWRCW